SSNGAYSAGSANKQGAIASNGNIALSNFATVNGDVRCGIGMTTTTGGTAGATGLVAPLAAALSYPSVTMPPSGSYTELGDVSMSSGSVSIPGGTYHLNSLN